MAAIFSAATLGFSGLTGVTFDEAAVKDFAAFKLKHGKKYAGIEEEAVKFENFKASKAKVAEINARPGTTWVAALNQFSDETWEDFKAARLMTPQNCSATHVSSGFRADPAKPVPDAIDWRDYRVGVVAQLRT